MKRFFLTGVVFLFFAVSGFSQTLEEVFTILNENIKTYPYAHLIALNKYDDDRSLRNPVKQFTRLKYDSETLDSSGDPLQGEMFYLTVIKQGYRYEMKIDFLPVQEKNARDIKTIRGQILRIVRDLDEATKILVAKNSETP